LLIFLSVHLKSFCPILPVCLVTRNIPHFDEYSRCLYESIDDHDLSYDLFVLALKGYNALKNHKHIENDRYLTIIDYSKPSIEKRFFVINLDSKELIYKSLVAHGLNTGIEYAASFSNICHSNKSSLGFFIPIEVYFGRNGYSLRLDGIETDFNSNARKRAIVIHGAEYVSEKFIDKYGRLGRSFGCPALPIEDNKDIINTIKGRSCLFIYYPDNLYLEKSPVLNSTT